MGVQAKPGKLDVYELIDLLAKTLAAIVAGEY